MSSLQNKLKKLNAQLKVTKGNRNKAKLVIKILAVEAAIEKMNQVVVFQAKEVKSERQFTKKPEKKTMKMFQERFEGAEIEFTETAINIKAGSLEMNIKTAIELPPTQNHRTLYKHLREAQTNKIHALYEVLAGVMLAS